MCGGSGIKNREVSSDSPAGRTRCEVVFAADLGGTHLRAATVDENGTIHFRLKQKTSQASEPDEIVRVLMLAMREAETQSQINCDSIRAISVRAGFGEWEMIVIGGGVVNAWDLFAKHLHREIAERAFPVPAKEVKVVPAERGDDAGLLGSAYLAFNPNLQSI